MQSIAVRKGELGTNEPPFVKGHRRTDTEHTFDSVISAAETVLVRTTSPPASDGGDDHSSDRSFGSFDDEERFEIKGVGLTFNRNVGTECLRTGVAINVDASVAEVLNTLRRKIAEQAAEAESTVRLMVQGSQYWYTTTPADKLFDSIVIEANSSAVAFERRRSDRRDDVQPACVCVVEPLPGNTDGKKSLATWLFRHDVLDGWRCLKYLTTLVFPEHELTVDRLRSRHQQQLKAQSRLSKIASSLTTTVASAALTPLALARLASLYRAPGGADVELRKFYLHSVVSVKALKALGKAKRLGSLTNTLTCVINAAFFAADPTRSRATVASNVLFDADAPNGNHVCLKVATVHVADNGTGESADKRAERALHSTASTIGASSQQLEDAWVAMASRAYVRGNTPERLGAAIEARQKNLDLLVSNLPAFDQLTPYRELDLQVVRDYDNWAPSIVYAVGVNDSIYLDFYMGVPKAFDDATFIKTFTEKWDVGATNTHTNLASCY